MVRNKHKCPKALWNKFVFEQRITYNEIMDYSKDQTLVSHPDYEIQKECWDTVRHNFAVLAAIAVKKCL